MIYNDEVRDIVNQLLNEELEKAYKKCLEFEKFSVITLDRYIGENYKNVLLLEPKTILNYIEKVEKTAQNTSEIRNVIAETKETIQNWINLYEGDTTKECAKILWKEKEELDDKFKQMTIENGDEQSLLCAGAVVGGIALRNLWRENGNLDGEMEEYPYTEEQQEMIKKYKILEDKFEDLSDYIELYEEFDEDEEEM